MVLDDFIFSCPGDPIRIEYAPIVRKDGNIELEPSGKFDLQKWYNDQAPGCDMHVIVSRYLAGDVDVLSRVQGVSFDATSYPKTYAEMLQKVIDGQRLFESLPVEVRREYDNDFNKFFSSASAPDFASKLFERLSSLSSPPSVSAPPSGDTDAKAKA